MTKTIAVFMRHGSRWDPKRGVREQDYWDDHARFMDALFDQGVVILGGPFADDSGSLVITAGRSGAFWRERRGMKAAEDGGMSPAERLRRVACFRDARHVEIADAGHMVHFDAPEELNRAILEFLASVDH